jgi:hypothetical protein
MSARGLLLTAAVPATVLAALTGWGWVSYVMDRRRWRAM